MDSAVLEEVFGVWAGRVQGLTQEQWGAPTRLVGWDVRDLVAHMAPDKQVLELLRGPRVAAPEVVGGAQMLRIYNMPGGVAHVGAERNAELAREAAGVGAATLVGYFVEDGPEVTAEFRRVDPNAGVVHPNPTIGTVSFGALIQVIIVEATVHLLDLIAAVGGNPVPDSTLRATTEILAEIPDPIAFIESATGRSTAAVLPVLR